MTTNSHQPPSDHEAALRQMDERLQHLGTPWRERAIAPERLMTQLQTLAAQERLVPATVPLQEEFTLMNTHQTPATSTRQPARWRVVFPAIAALLVILVGSFVVFHRRPSAPTTQVYATPTVTRTHLPSGTLQRFPTGRYAPVTITTGGDGNIWFTAYDVPFQKGFYPPGAPLVIGKVSRAGTVQTFPVPTMGLAAGEVRESLTLGTAGAHGETWFPLIVSHLTATSDTVQRMEVAKVSPQGQITIYPIASLGANTAWLWSLTLGADDAIWFTTFTSSSNGINRIGKMTSAGEVTWLSDSRITSTGYLTTGPDGNVWFENGYQLGCVTPQGNFTFYPMKGELGGPLAFDAQGQLWFVERHPPVSAHGSEQVFLARFTLTSKTITRFLSPYQAPISAQIMAGPERTIWLITEGVAQAHRFALHRVAGDGTVSEVALPADVSLYVWVIDGRDGNLWFIDYQQTGDNQYTNFIGRLTP